MIRPIKKIKIKLPQFFNFDAICNSTLTDIWAALFVSLVTTGSFFYILLSFEPFTTTPGQLIGAYAYLMDINITNRIISVTLTILFSTLIFLCILNWLSINLLYKERLHRSLACSLLPALLWLTSCALVPVTTINPYGIYLSTILCWATFWGFHRENKYINFINTTELWISALALSTFLFPAINSFAKPVFTYFFPEQLPVLLKTINSFLVLCYWIPLLTIFTFGFIKIHRALLIKYLILPLQLVLLLSFCSVLPSGFVIDDKLVSLFSPSRLFLVIILPLFVIGCFDCLRRCFYDNDRSIISPFVLLSLLFLLLLENNPIPGFISNAFEHGARFPIFWASYEGWASIFKDIYSSYGFYDYSWYLFGLFFAGDFTAGMGTYGILIVKLLLISITFLFACYFLPSIPIFLLFYWIGYYDKLLIIIFLYLILLLPYLIQRPFLWAIVWLTISAFAPFFIVPHGSIFVASTIPSFIWQCRQSFKTKPIQFAFLLAILSFFTFIYLFGPLSNYFYGLITFYLENAKVNSWFHANHWIINNTAFLKVLLGNTMIILPIASLAVIFIALQKKSKDTNYFPFFYLVSFVFLYTFLMVSYGYSRTDYQPFVRQYGVLKTILPILLIFSLVYTHKKVSYVVFSSVILCFLAIEARPFPSPDIILTKMNNFQTINQSNINNGIDYGLPHMGSGYYSKKYLFNAANRKSYLDKLLGVNETYLDLSLFGGNYFSAQRKFVTEYPIFWVTPGESAQYRVIEALKANNIKVSLLHPDTIDSSSVSLRTHFLYRYAILNGLALKISDKETLVIPPDYFSRVGQTAPSLEKNIKLLDSNFPIRNLNFLPSVWGRGYSGLSGSMTKIRSLPTPDPSIHTNMLEWRLPLLPFANGLKAGILVLEIDMPKDAIYDMEVSWDGQGVPNNYPGIFFKGKDGILIIPLDTYPAWLLSPKLSTIVIKAKPPNYQNIRRYWRASQMSTFELNKLIYSQNVEQFISNKFIAVNHDPILVFALPEKVRNHSIIVHLVFDAPTGNNLSQIFYRDIGEEYNELNSMKLTSKAGHNDLLFVVPADKVQKEIRIDPGNIPGGYTIKKLEIAINRSNIFSPIMLKRAELMQRHNIIKLGLDKLAYTKQ
jgi:hypothetical protein